MTATNHTSTGILIGTLLPAPIAIPLALASHFLLDSIPHYSDDNVTSDQQKFLRYLIIDGALAASLLISVVILVPQNWILLTICGVMGALPDLMWLPHWLKSGQTEKKVYSKKLERFHHNIQWSESKRGLIIEAFWFTAILSLLAVNLW